MLVRRSFANNIPKSSRRYRGRAAKEGFAMSTRSGLIFVLFPAVVVSLFAGTVCGQDSQSLGDLARQQRQQKEQSKTAPGKDVKTSKIITNEEIPERSGPASVPAMRGHEAGSSMPASSNEAKLPAEHWKSQILAQKNQIDSLQRQVDEINESIRFAPANCVEGCVGWNERQREKQQRVERMQEQLEEQKRRLDDLQDSARKQGYGSSVYDP
jgi:C4-dicarboxylate-specific signal transduction histidine kinase